MAKDGFEEDSAGNVLIHGRIWELSLLFSAYGRRVVGRGWTALRGLRLL